MPASMELFAEAAREPHREVLAPGAVLLRGFACPRAPALIQALAQVLHSSPFRFMTTPGGYRMSVAMTNSGAVGWVSESRGYRYAACDPLSGAPWPELAPVLRELAAAAAAQAGFAGFEPDACLINRYQPGARLSLHQDRDERDLGSPIVSVSLGLPAVFQLGGHRRADRPRRVPLAHGDVLVFGGESRLRFHGVLPLREGCHAKLGDCRINLSLRKAL
jgi:alkylated DNA repair protein (DNA oxidative demethylase)